MKLKTMREIKFRAWQKEVKGLKKEKMIDFETISKSWTFYEFLNPEKNGRILMQSTSLHDKNGKEIYEGDIVRQGNNLCVINDCVGGFHCQMFFELKNGGTIESSTYDFSFLSEKYCEVIGNIYENPELLESNG